MDDIKTVQDNAVLSRLAMQVTLILDVERILPDCIRRRFAILYGLMLTKVKYLKTKAIYKFASLFHKYAIIEKSRFDMYTTFPKFLRKISLFSFML